MESVLDVQRKYYEHVRETPPPMLPHSNDPKAVHPTSRRRKKIPKGSPWPKFPTPNSHVPRPVPASDLPEGFPPELAFRALAAYSFIRTLGVELRLSPFTPNVFLRALYLPYPNRLIGKIHVAFLRILLTNLQLGYHWNDKTPSLDVVKKRRIDGIKWLLRAGDNLRFLDTYTWPLFYDDYCHLTADTIHASLHDRTDYVDLRALSVAGIESDSERLNREMKGESQTERNRRMKGIERKKNTEILYLNPSDNDDSSEDEKEPYVDVDEEDDDEYVEKNSRSKTKRNGKVRQRRNSASKIKASQSGSKKALHQSDVIEATSRTSRMAQHDTVNHDCSANRVNDVYRACPDLHSLSSTQKMLFHNHIMPSNEGHLPINFDNRLANNRCIMNQNYDNNSALSYQQLFTVSGAHYGSFQNYSNQHHFQNYSNQHHLYNSVHCTSNPYTSNVPPLHYSQNHLPYANLHVNIERPVLRKTSLVQSVVSEIFGNPSTDEFDFVSLQGPLDKELCKEHVGVIPESIQTISERLKKDPVVRIEGGSCHHGNRSNSQATEISNTGIEASASKANSSSKRENDNSAPMCNSTQRSSIDNPELDETITDSTEVTSSQVDSFQVINDFVRGKKTARSDATSVRVLESLKVIDDVDKKSTFVNASNPWTHFDPIKTMRCGIPYHRVNLEGKLAILEFLIDELLSVDLFAELFAHRQSHTCHVATPFSRLPTEEELANVENEDECRICRQEGDLICCDGCPSSYHRGCLLLPNGDLPDGLWLCPECTLKDPATFGPLHSGKKGSLDWFTIEDIISAHKRVINEDEVRNEVKMDTILSQEFMVIHGYVFRRSKKIVDLKTPFSPLKADDVKGLLTSIGPTLSAQWPLVQIPFESSLFGIDKKLSLTPSYFHQDEGRYNPSQYNNKYRKAPPPLWLQQIVDACSCDYEIRCTPAPTSLLSTFLSSDFSNDTMLAKSLSSSRIIFDAYKMINCYFVKLEGDLLRGSFLNERWKTIQTSSEKKTWKYKVKHCLSVPRLAKFLVELIDATHPRAFIDVWYQGSSHKSKSAELDKGANVPLKITDGFDPKLESVRRKWIRCPDYALSILVAKERKNFASFVHSIRPDFGVYVERRNKRKHLMTSKSIVSSKTVFIEPNVLEDCTTTTHKEQTESSHVADVGNNTESVTEVEYEAAESAVGLRKRKSRRSDNFRFSDPNGEKLEGVHALIFDEKKRNVSELVSNLKNGFVSEVHWTIAGRKLFEPNGSLSISTCKHLGRNAGMLQAPFIAYSQTHEVGQAAYYHIWRKRAMQCNSFEDLLFIVRVLESVLDHVAIKKGGTLTQRFKGAKLVNPSEILCTQLDIKTGLENHLVVKSGQSIGRWYSCMDIDLSPLILEKFQRRNEYVTEVAEKRKRKEAERLRDELRLREEKRIREELQRREILRKQAEAKEAEIQRKLEAKKAKEEALRLKKNRRLEEEMRKNNNQYPNTPRDFKHPMHHLSVPPSNGLSVSISPALQGVGMLQHPTNNLVAYGTSFEAAPAIRKIADVTPELNGVLFSSMQNDGNDAMNGIDTQIKPKNKGRQKKNSDGTTTPTVSKKRGLGTDNEKQPRKRNKKPLPYATLCTNVVMQHMFKSQALINKHGPWGVQQSDVYFLRNEMASSLSSALVPGGAMLSREQVEQLVYLAESDALYLDTMQKSHSSDNKKPLRSIEALNAMLISIRPPIQSHPSENDRGATPINAPVETQAPSKKRIVPAQKVRLNAAKPKSTADSRSLEVFARHKEEFHRLMLLYGNRVPPDLLEKLRRESGRMLIAATKNTSLQVSPDQVNSVLTQCENQVKDMATLTTGNSKSNGTNFDKTGTNVVLQNSTEYQSQNSYNKSRPAPKQASQDTSTHYVDKVLERHKSQISTLLQKYGTSLPQEELEMTRNDTISKLKVAYQFDGCSNVGSENFTSILMEAEGELINELSGVPKHHNTLHTDEILTPLQNRTDNNGTQRSGHQINTEQSKFSDYTESLTYMGLQVNQVNNSYSQSQVATGYGSTFDSNDLKSVSPILGQRNIDTPYQHYSGRNHLPQNLGTNAFTGNNQGMVYNTPSPSIDWLKESNLFGLNERTQQVPQYQQFQDTYTDQQKTWQGQTNQSTNNIYDPRSLAAMEFQMGGFNAVPQPMQSQLSTQSLNFPNDDMNYGMYPATTTTHRGGYDNTDFNIGGALTNATTDSFGNNIDTLNTYDQLGNVFENESTHQFRNVFNSNGGF